MVTGSDTKALSKVFLGDQVWAHHFYNVTGWQNDNHIWNLIKIFCKQNHKLSLIITWKNFHFWRPDEEMLCFTDRPIVSETQGGWWSIREWSLAALLLPPSIGQGSQYTRSVNTNNGPSVFIDAYLHLSRDHNAANAFTAHKKHHRGCTLFASVLCFYCFSIP